MRRKTGAGSGDNFPDPAFFCSLFHPGMDGSNPAQAHEGVGNRGYFSTQSLNLALIRSKLTEFIGFNKNFPLQTPNHQKRLALWIKF